MMGFCWAFVGLFSFLLHTNCPNKSKKTQNIKKGQAPHWKVVNNCIRNETITLHNHFVVRQLNWFTTNHWHSSKLLWPLAFGVTSSGFINMSECSTRFIRQPSAVPSLSLLFFFMINWFDDKLAIIERKEFSFYASNFKWHQLATTTTAINSRANTVEKSQTYNHHVASFTMFFSTRFDSIVFIRLHIIHTFTRRTVLVLLLFFFFRSIQKVVAFLKTQI